MFDRLKFLVRYYLFWTALFVGARLVFLAYEHDASAHAGPGTLARIVLHGLRMDLSAAAYATVLPGVLVVLGLAVAPRIVKAMTRWYTVMLIALVALATAGDLGIYDAWGFRLDATPFRYFTTPREAIASAESSPVLLFALIAAALAVAGILAYRRWVEPALDESRRAGAPAAALALSATALLLVPIRGGLQWTPLNQSSVYFSSDEFANQAALNVPWNIVHSLTTNGALERTNPYTAIDAATAHHLADSLFATAAGDPHLLRIARPNVILIMWESLTAKVVGRLGGVPGVTPHFDSLTHEGVFFDHFYASGDRSAKGLVAVLAGFPPLPHVQVMNEPNRAARLPMLSRDFDAAGYETSFYYGGELAFANIKSFLLDGRFDHLVGESAFPPNERNSKWGAHDQFVLGRLLRDVGGMRRPFFSTLFTLSSHEPFEVPMAPRFPGRDQTDEFLSSHAYADRSVGEFIRAAQRQPWWDSTLVIIVADHGHPLPRVTAAAGMPAASRQHIPMLWLGGALVPRDSVVSRFGSQTDLAPTLLAQLGLPHARYAWGRDLFAPHGASFAYFSYLDGFGFLDPNGGLVYDALAKRVTERVGDAGEPELRAGQALLRLSYQAYLDR